MSHGTQLVLFVACAIINFWAFGMQRTTLLLAREAGVPQQLTAGMLPAWFPVIWVTIIGRWILLAYTAFSWSWLVAAGLAVADYLFSIYAPIPHWIYVSGFRKRIHQLSKSQPEIAEYLNFILSRSQLTAED